MSNNEDWLSQIEQAGYDAPPLTDHIQDRKTAADSAAPESESEQGFFGDAGDAFQMGAGQAASGMAETVNQLTGSETAGRLREATQNWSDGQLDQMSESGRSAMGKQFFSEDENGNTQFGEAWTDPESIGLQVSNLAGQLAGQVSTGFGFTGVVAKVGAKVLAKNLIAKGLQKGMTQEAAELYAKSVIRSGAGVTGQALAGAGITGGQMGIQVRDEIMGLSDAELDESNEFRKLYWGLYQQNPGTPVSELRQTAAKTLAERTATAVQADPLTIASNLTLDAIGGRFIDNMIRGVGTGKRLTNAATQGAGQFATEAAQGGMEQINVNRAMVNEGVDPTRRITEGALANALNEGVLGGAVGAVAGGAFKGKPEDRPSISEQAASLSESDAGTQDQPSDSQVQQMMPLNEAVEQIKQERGQYRGIDDDIRIAEAQGFDDEAVRLRAAKRNFQMAEDFANEGDLESAKRFNERALKIYREVTQMGEPDPERRAPGLPAEYVAIGEYVDRAGLPAQQAEPGETYDEVAGLRPEVSDYEPDPARSLPHPDSVDAPYFTDVTDVPDVEYESGSADVEDIELGDVQPPVMEVDEVDIPPVLDVDEIDAIPYEKPATEKPGLSLAPQNDYGAIDYNAGDDGLGDSVKDEIRKHKLPRGLNDGRLLRSRFRAGLENMAAELIPGGGITSIPLDPMASDNPDKKYFDWIPSQNPDWFKNAPDEVKRLGVKGFQKTVVQALAGRKLGKGQARAIRYMLDYITGERNEYARTHARPDREDFVKFRKVMRGEMTPQEAGFADSDPVPQRFSDAIKRIASSAEQRFTDADYEAVPGGNGVGRALADDIREALEAGLPEDVVTEIAKQFGDDPVEFSLRLFVFTEAHKNGQEVRPASVVRAADKRAVEKQAANRGEDPEWVRTKSEPETEEELLTSYTEEDLRQMDAKRQQAEKVSSENELEAQQKAAADLASGSFSLTGSDSEADRAAAAGQGDLLSSANQKKDIFSDSEHTNGKGVDFDDPELKKIIDHRVEVAKKEILEDVDNEIIDPSKVSGWEDLDDFADANMYINDADRGDDRMVGPYGKRHGWRYDEFVDFTARLIEEVDGWIKSGGLNKNEDKTPAPAGVSVSADQKNKSTAPEHLNEAKAAEAKGPTPEGPVDKAGTGLPEILSTPRKAYIKKMARSEGLKPSSPGYDSAIKRLEDQYDSDVDRAQAGLSFGQFNELNSDSPEGVNRQAWEALREEYGEPGQAEEIDDAAEDNSFVSFFTAKAGDYLGAGFYLVQKGISAKSLAERIAKENDGSIAIDGDRSWAVLSKRKTSPVIRNSAGNPYKSMGAARKALKANPGYEIYPVDTGFELRRQVMNGGGPAPLAYSREQDLKGIEITETVKFKGTEDVVEITLPAEEIFNDLIKRRDALLKLRKCVAGGES